MVKTFYLQCIIYAFAKVNEISNNPKWTAFKLLFGLEVSLAGDSGRWQISIMAWYAFSFGKAIRRNVVVKRTLDIWSPGEEAFTNLKVCDWWWGVWLQLGLLSEALDLCHTDKLGRQWKSWVDVTIWQLS